MIVRVILYFTLIFSVSACALKPVEVKKYSDFSSYKYVYISKAKNVISSGVTNGYYYTYGYTTVLNPVDIIAGKFMKKGLVIVNEINHPEETLIVNYAESGRREVLKGFAGDAVEISIQVINAKNSDLVYLCSAEGQGEMEADNIREAISRCLNDM